MRSVSDQSDLLPARERARVRSRDRKVRGPRVVVDNPGLKKLLVDLANRRRRRSPSARQQPKPPKPR